MKYNILEKLANSILKGNHKNIILRDLAEASCLFFCHSYSCEWSGVVEGKPYLKNLEDFGKAVLEDLWTAVVKQFVEVSHSDDSINFISILLINPTCFKSFNFEQNMVLPCFFFIQTKDNVKRHIKNTLQNIYKIIKVVLIIENTPLQVKVLNSE